MNRLRVYECQWCTYSGSAAGFWTHRCPDMVEALALLGVTPRDVRKFAAAAAAGESMQDHRPFLRVVRDDASSANSKEAP